MSTQHIHEEKKTVSDNHLLPGAMHHSKFNKNLTTILMQTRNCCVDASANYNVIQQGGHTFLAIKFPDFSLIFP